MLKIQAKSIKEYMCAPTKNIGRAKNKLVVCGVSVELIEGIPVSSLPNQMKCAAQYMNKINF